MRLKAPVLAILIVLSWSSALFAQQPLRQTQEDDYTRYELLGPDTAQFRILYEVTATTAGAPYFFNAIRLGSVATDESVVDMMTGQPLKWEVVSGKQARAEGHPTADLETEWLKVYLARPVPKGSEGRVLIDKTDKDAKSYFRDGDTIVFDRSLGIRRNAVVLPAGYRLISCNVPSQVMATDDGRVMITFMNTSAAAAPLVIRAKPGLAPLTQKLPTTRGASAPVTMASQAVRLSGSSVSNPSAVLLDTGEVLKVETLSGADLKKRGLHAGEPVTDTTQIVVISFPAVTAGQSVRLRITETYTDANRYLLDGDELVWDRAFGRPRNAVVLPAGSRSRLGLSAYVSICSSSAFCACRRFSA